MGIEQWILPFGSAELSSELTGVELAGGKGANLARIAQAGFPVPEGFIISTLAYHNYVSENHLENEIQDALTFIPERAASPEELETVSTRIRKLFTRAGIST